MGTMLDNCIVKNGFKTRMKALLYLLLNISNMPMHKGMLIKTNETLRRDKYPLYGERLSSIEDTGTIKVFSHHSHENALLQDLLSKDLHGALKMSDRSAAISDAENNNENTITVSTRCTTDEPIKLGGYVPASDSGEEKKDQEEIKKTVKVLGLHNEPNEIGKEIDEDSGQDDEDKPHKEYSKENKGKEAGKYSKYSNYKKEDKKKNEKEEEYKDGEELEKEDEEKGKDKDEKARKDKNEKEGKDKDEKEGTDMDDKEVKDAHKKDDKEKGKDEKEGEGKDDEEGEYKDEEEIGKEDEEKGKDKDEKAGNDNDRVEEKGWEPYADKESEEGNKDSTENMDEKEWMDNYKEITNSTRVTKKYAAPEARDAPDHYIDDI